MLIMDLPYEKWDLNASLVFSECYSIKCVDRTICLGPKVDPLKSKPP
jgi:hypothetical protein